MQYAIGFKTKPGPEWRPVAPDIWERDAVPEARLAERVTFADPQDTQPSWKALVQPGFDARPWLSRLLSVWHLHSRLLVPTAFQP